MARIMRFLADHGETLIYSVMIVVVVTVIVPTINAHDEARYAAHLASK